MLKEAVALRIEAFVPTKSIKLGEPSPLFVRTSDADKKFIAGWNAFVPEIKPDLGTCPKKEPVFEIDAVIQEYCFAFLGIGCWI